MYELNFEFPLLDGTMKNLRDYDGMVVLVVNTAGRCGFTPQYEGLQELYMEFRDQGFVVLAFPCNQFGAQEPGTDEEIRRFLDENFTVTFPVFSKTEVNGENANPLFRMLKEAAPGTMGTIPVKWNFTKFLISRDRKRVFRFASVKKPENIRMAVAGEISRT